MSLEVLHAEFDAYKQECTRDRNALANNMKENLLAMNTKLAVMQASLENKVTFEYFHWVIGVLVVILVAVQGYIVMQNKELSQQLVILDRTSAVVQNDVKAVKDKLSPYNIEYSR